MPKLLIASGSVGFIAKGCSEEERLLFGSKAPSEVQAPTVHASLGMGR